MDFGPFEFQLMCWGAAYSGDAAEQDACLAERSVISDLQLRWDKTLASLRCIEIWDGDRRVRVPEWHCFAWFPPISLEDAVARMMMEDANAK